VARTISIRVGAPPATGITHGRQINASNTGLNYNGINPGSLTPVAGSQDYSTNGQVIEGKSFTDRIDISGSNITMRNCKLVNGGDASFGFVISGSGITVEGCTVTAPSGQSLYEPFAVLGATNATIRRCDISKGAQYVTAQCAGLIIEESYCHDLSIDSDPTQHPDGLEIWGGSGYVIRRNKITMEAFLADGVVDIGAIPSGTPDIAGCLVEDNYLQGGQEIILSDNTHAPTGDITFLIVRRNDMDQHTDPVTFGYSRALTDYDSRPIVGTGAAQAANPSAILWPTSGVDVNRWVNPDGVTPDYAGMIIVPPQGAA